MRNEASAAALEALANSMRTTIEHKKTTDAVGPGEEVYAMNIVDEFSTSGHHPGPTSWHTEYVTEQNWLAAAMHLSDEIKALKEYSDALFHMKNSTEGYEGPDVKFVLDQWTHRLSMELLDGSSTEDRVSKAIELVLGELRGEPQETTSISRINGIVVDGPPITVKVAEAAFVLRSVQKEDFESKRSLHMANFHSHDPHHRPTAVLEVTMKSHGGEGIQKTAAKANRILTLFQVAGVVELSLKLGGPSYIGGGGTLHHGSIQTPARNAIITADESEKLRKFWRTMWTMVPTGIGASQENQGWDIAYARYREAIAATSGWEARLASAVMGLEGLLLGDDEKNELTYKLSMRLAKTMSCLGADTSNVVETAKDAYRVRSVYVHGGQLSYKQRQKYERKHGSLDQLLHQCTDWLRMILVSYLVCNLDKEQFLDQLDEGMISVKGHDTIESRLTAASSVLS